MIAAVLDACVLYSAPLRDLFMYLTVHFVFQPKWTDRILAEWIENVLVQRPDLSRKALDRTRALMNRWAGDWQVPAHDQLIPTLVLPDPGDRHVLAAAVAGQVPLVVTFNLSDFPAEVLAVHGIRAAHPDDFASALFDDTPEPFLQAVRTHRAALRNPPRSADEYLATLSKCGLCRTAERLTEHHGGL